MNNRLTPREQRRETIACVAVVLELLLIFYFFPA